jgi:hypothetical protein
MKNINENICIGNSFEALIYPHYLIKNRSRRKNRTVVSLVLLVYRYKYFTYLNKNIRFGNFYPFFRQSNFKSCAENLMINKSKHCYLALKINLKIT